MPQPKSERTSSGGAKQAPARPRRGAPEAAPPLPADPAGMLEPLTKGILLTADRIQEAMDDAVRRGRMTRDDAEDLVAALVDAGRKQTEDLLHDLEELVGRAAGEARNRVGDRLLREGDRARRVAGLGRFPISRYDDLTAAQITARLTDLSAAELRKVRDYERRHGNRKSVLGAVERKLS